MAWTFCQTKCILKSLSYIMSWSQAKSKRFIAVVWIILTFPQSDITIQLAYHFHKRWQFKWKWNVNTTYLLELRLNNFIYDLAHHKSYIRWECIQWGMKTFQAITNWHLYMEILVQVFKLRVAKKRTVNRNFLRRNAHARNNNYNKTGTKCLVVSFITFDTEIVAKNTYSFDIAFTYSASQLFNSVQT